MFEMTSDCTGRRRAYGNCGSLPPAMVERWWSRPDGKCPQSDYPCFSRTGRWLYKMGGTVTPSSCVEKEARAFLEAYCRKAPHTPSSALQPVLQERFELHVSSSQINRVRAALGISNHCKSQMKASSIRVEKPLLTYRHVHYEPSMLFSCRPRTSMVHY
jgi:hypothetical protein